MRESFGRRYGYNECSAAVDEPSNTACSRRLDWSVLAAADAWRWAARPARDQPRESFAMTWIEVVDSAMKISLGAVVAGGFGYLNARLAQRKDDQARYATRRRDHLEDSRATNRSRAHLHKPEGCARTTSLLLDRGSYKGSRSITGVRCARREALRGDREVYARFYRSAVAWSEGSRHQAPDVPGRRR